MAKAKKTKTTASPTLVTFLLDRSGSMKSCWDSTIEAFNGYLDGLQDTPNLDFSLIQFDHNAGVMDLNKVCVGVPVKEAPRLSRENYVPRGSTPLIDAAYTVIKAVEASLESKPKVSGRHHVPTKVVVCIQTDGQENCSRLYGWEALAALIKSKQDAGWQFNFMGAGIDAYQQGRQMGIAPQSTMSYDSSSLRATRAAFSGRAHATQLYASGMSANMNIGAAEKLAAGDKFDPDGAKARADLLKTLHGGAAALMPSPFLDLNGGLGSAGDPNNLDLKNARSEPPKKEAFKL